MRLNPNEFKVFATDGGFAVEDAFGELVLTKELFRTETEAQRWINEQIDNWEPADPLGWEGGFADNH